MSFLETIRFPDDISYGSKGGPNFNTTIIEVDSGYEQRNINWAYPKSMFDVSFGVRQRTQLYDLVKFFRAAHGMGHTFRYKDWADFNSHHGDQLTQAPTSTDQLIGTGDAVEVEFQLIKHYDEGILTGTRLIQKPVAGTTIVSINDVDQGAEGGTWNVDTTTGKVVFDTAPGGGLEVKAGYEFDVPVRFDNDGIETNYEYYDGGNAAVTLTEVRITQ